MFSESDIFRDIHILLQKIFGRSVDIIALKVASNKMTAFLRKKYFIAMDLDCYQYIQFDIYLDRKSVV